MYAGMSIFGVSALHFETRYNRYTNFYFKLKRVFSNQLLVQNCLPWKLATNLSIAIYFQFTIFNHPRK